MAVSRRAGRRRTGNARPRSGDLKSVSGKRLAKLAEDKGWHLALINGSHHIFTIDGRSERLVIPIHGDQTLKIGLQRSLTKLIPVTEEEL